MKTIDRKVGYDMMKWMNRSGSSFLFPAYSLKIKYIKIK